MKKIKEKKTETQTRSKNGGEYELHIITKVEKTLEKHVGNT